MLIVHKMPLKNQFQIGISSGYDKTPIQNELQPFTSINFSSDYTFDFLGKESCGRVNSNLAGTGIVYNTMLKPDAEMIPFDGDFESFRFNFEIETSKSDNFMMIFPSCASPY